MAEIAEAAGVGRATLYRHFPSRESLLRAVARAGFAELVEGFGAARLDQLPADRAIARIVAVFLREGIKYAAVIRQAAEYQNPADTECTERPVREVINRGMRDRVLRDDLPGEAVFAMFCAMAERALWLTADGTITPEEAAEAVMAIFMNGARWLERS